MPGSKPTLTCLEARKQLLLVESELNRVEWCQDCAALKEEVTALVDEGRSVINTASFAIAGFKSVRRFWAARHDRDGSRPGVVALLLKLVTTAASVWRTSQHARD